MARPRIKKPKDTLDALNLLNEGTQMVKSIKISESVYNRLKAYKKNDKKMKSLSDVITALIAIAEMKD